LIDTVTPKLTSEEFNEKYKIGTGVKVVALLPGSRTAEIANILPMMLRSASLVASRVENVRFLLAASSRSNRALIDKVIKKADGKVEVTIVENATYDCLARCDFAIITSGTATLEAAILGKPMVIVYGGSWIVEQEYKLRRRSLNIEHFGMPNIIAGERIVPEVIFIEGRGPDEVADITVANLTDDAKRGQESHILKERVLPTLGKPGVIDRAASSIWEFLVAN